MWSRLAFRKKSGCYKMCCFFLQSFLKEVSSYSFFKGIGQSINLPSLPFSTPVLFQTFPLPSLYSSTPILFQTCPLPSLSSSKTVLFQASPLPRLSSSKPVLSKPVLFQAYILLSSLKPIFFCPLPSLYSS